MRLAAAARQARSERYIFRNRTCERDVAAATCDEELVVGIRALQSFMAPIEATNTHANMVEGRARETIDNMSKLRSLDERLTLTVSKEHARVAKLVEVQLSGMFSVVAAALSKIESAIRNASCGKPAQFDFKASSVSSDPSAESPTSSYRIILLCSLS